MFNKDFPFIDKDFKNPAGGVLNPDDYAIPCGYAARAYYNDTFIMLNDKSEEIKILDKDIAWYDDKNHRFKN